MVSTKQIYSDYLRSGLWQRLRAKAIERDKGLCSFCGRKFKDVHHIKYPKRYTEDHIDNIVCVCRNCHERLHGLKRDEKLLANVIEQRILKGRINEFGFPEYHGLSMIGVGSDDKDRNENWDFMQKHFKDYIPHMKIENFRLFSWKGGICWDEYEEDVMGDNQEKDFTSWETKDIVRWIIINKGDKNSNS